MDFVSSIKRNCTTAAYAQFDGRASRSEYWWFYLFTLLVSAAADSLGGTAGNLASLFFLLPSDAGGHSINIKGIEERKQPDPVPDPNAGAAKGGKAAAK